MIKLLIKSFSLIGFLYLSMLAIASFDNKHILSDDNILRLRAAEKEKQIDELFIGSSYVYSGIIPAILDSFGLHSFNLGIATSGPYFNEVVINDFLSVHVKPKSIFIAIAYTSFSDLASDSWENYPIHRYLKNPLSNEKVLIRYARPNMYFKMLRKSFKKGTENVFRIKTGLDSIAFADIIKTKGYYKSLESTNTLKMQEERDLFLPYLESTYSERKEKKLFDIIADCQKADIDVFLLEPPTYKLESFFSEKYKKQYEEFIEKLPGKSIKILRCAKNSYDSTCFRNIDHLNFKGAVIYTNYLKDTISSL